MKAIKNSVLGLFGITGVVLSIFGIKVPFSESFAKEHWRAGLTALLFVILLIPAAIGLFLYWVDANRFKDEIVQFVKAQTQRDLVLQGDLKVTLFPKLGIDSGKMSLSQRNSAKEFASVDNARLYIAWWPLLKKQLVFERVEFDGVHANLARYKDGTTNFDDLLISNGTLSSVTFDIQGLRITNSSVNWLDEIQWQRVALQDVRVETGRLADTVPGNIKASFHLISEKLHSESNVGLNSRLFYDLKAGRCEFADIEGTLDGTVAGFSNLALNFKGSVDSRNMDSPSGQGSLLAENIAVSGRGNYGQRNVEAKFGLPRLQFARGVLSGSHLALDVASSQFEEKWIAAVQVPSFEFSSQIFSASKLDADFDFKGEQRSLQGNLSGSANVDWTAAPKLQLGAITLNLTARNPLLSGELSAKATGSMQADFAERNANLDFNARLDDSDIKGSLAVKDFIHPVYSFNLSTNRLDLDRYLVADWSKRYLGDATRFDPGGIKGLNATGHLRADEFRALKFKATKLAADIRIGQDTLAVEPLTAKLYGGALTGSLSVSVQGTPQFALKSNLKGVQMNALIADTASAGKVSGKGDVVLDMNAQGSSVGELRKTLNGGILFALTHGSIAGIDLRSTLLENMDKLGVKNEAHVVEEKTGGKRSGEEKLGAEKTQVAKFDERTEFFELKASINFKEGVSNGNSFDLRSPLFRVAGVGDFAPDSGNVNYQLVVTMASTLKRRNAGALAELQGVAVPIRVSGAYAMPSITLDFAAASGGIVTSRIAAKTIAQQLPTAKPAITKKSRRVKPAGSQREDSGKGEGRA